MALNINLHKALTSTRKRRVEAEKALEREKEKEKELLAKLESQFTPPENGKDGRDGKDAPKLDEIVREVIPFLPEPRIIKTTETVVQKVDEEKIRQLIKEAAPEPTIPEIQVIREEVNLDTDAFLTKEEFQDALRRIDQAILNSAGGSGGLRKQIEAGLIKRIDADQVSNVITLEQLDKTKINIVHVTVAGSSVQLPKASLNYLVWVEDAVLGGGNITITRET